MTDTAEGQNRSPAAAAEAVVRTAFAELDAMRWSKAAALVHPETLARFRAWQVHSARVKERHRNGPLRPDPAMPPEVVAWHEEQGKKAEEQRTKLGPMLSYRFAGIETIEQLEALSAEELFARHLQANDPRERINRHMREQGKEIPAESAEKIEEVLLAQRAVIGSTLEDESTVQVVYRTHFNGDPERDQGRVAVVTVRRTPEGWRIWTGSQDSALFDDHPGYSFLGFLTPEEEQERLRVLAETVITWSVEGAGEGRAFVTGYTGGMEPPKALVIEIPRPNGAKVRVEIPVEAFGRLAAFLNGWPLPESR